MLAIAERDVDDESTSDLEAGARPLGIVG
ncbi:MAG: hypothetical protein HW413_2793, partial [Thermoleophilia bacterium]|nr:hypothetical protein [Thermoleophilia bacterium]